MARGACDGPGVVVLPACGRPQCEGVFSVLGVSQSDLDLEAGFYFFRIRKIVIQSVLFFWGFLAYIQKTNHFALSKGKLCEIVCILNMEFNYFFSIKA